MKQPLFKTHYGWVIVVIAAMAMVATLPGRTHGLGMVTERLLADPAFSMTRVQYGEINLCATLLGGLFCLPCGYLIDRFGLRMTLTGTVLALAGVVLWMTRLSGNTALFVAVLLTRGFGQSALSVLSITMVGKWFRGHLSFPMAVYSLILSLGFAGAAQVAKPFANDDWRVVWGGMGWLLLLIMTPVAWLLTREPAAVVTAADSSSDPAGRPGTLLDQSGDDSPGFTLIQALQTPAFWVFGLSISMLGLISSGLSLFSESVLTSQGFPVEAYYNLITLTGVIGLLVKLPVGHLGRYIPLGRFQAIALVLQAACLVWLPTIRTPGELTGYAVGMGISGTISTVLFFSIWGQAYGRKHLGRIQGVSQMLTVLASAIGPLLLAKCHEQTGSYASIFQSLAAATVVLSIASWLVKVPRPEDALLLKNSSQSLSINTEESLA